MSMGNLINSNNGDKNMASHGGQIISCYRKILNNNDPSSIFMHGTLMYQTGMNNTKTIEFCTKSTDLNVDDIVTFNFCSDKTALNPYANNVNKYDFSKDDKKEREMAQNGFDNDDDIEMDNKRKRKNNKRNKKRSAVRLICISDTHNSHEQLTKELNTIYESESDILIHCGDMTDGGSERELKAVNKWFGKLPFKHIIITAGNMDGIGLDSTKYSYNKSKESIGKSIFTNAIYLEHESYYLKEYDLQFFASPYSMRFVGGFQINDESQAKKLWNAVPSSTDILICHGPPLNILDSTSRGKHAGDKILFEQVIDRIKPKVMCFGHMHSSFGYKKFKDIHFYNCAQNNALNGGHGHGYNYNYNQQSKANKEKPCIVDLSSIL